MARPAPDSYDQAAWTLDESGVPFVSDGAGGTGANLTAVDGTITAQQAGIHNYGVRFPGGGKNLIRSADTSIGAATEFTISFWVYPYGWNSRGVMVAKEYHAQGEAWASPYYSVGVALRDTNDGRWMFVCTRYGSYAETMNDSMWLSTGKWYFLAVVGSESGQYVKCYQNCALVNTWSNTMSFGWGDPGPWVVGADRNSQGFNGIIDDVRVANTVRSHQDLWNLYVAGIPGRAGDAQPDLTYYDSTRSGHGASGAGNLEKPSEGSAGIGSIIILNS